MSLPVRRTFRQLLHQGWNEYPEVMGSTLLAFVGVGLAVAGCYKYVQRDGDNRRYKTTYVIMRPDDPRVKLIKKRLNVDED